MNLAQARDGLGADRFHEVDRPECEHGSGAGTENGKDDTFGQALPKQTPPARADGDANRHFPFPDRGTGEEHGGEIGAGNQQNEPDCAGKDKKKRLHTPDDRFLEGEKRGTEAIGLRIVVGIMLAHRPNDRVDLGLSLR